MWKFLVVLLSAFACSKSFIVLDPEDDIISSYKHARARLTPEQEEFLTELWAADEALMAQATGRGVVDDVLAALSGVGGNIRVNVIGGGQPQPIAAAPAPAPAPVQGPTFTFQTSSLNQQRQQPLVVASGTVPQQQPAQAGSVGTTVVGGNNNHLFSSISNVIRNSGTRNVSGIVDQSLRIATPAPIRELVTGIFQVAYCNGIRRLLGRC